jgi:hypothetical protein
MGVFIATGVAHAVRSCGLATVAAAAGLTEFAAIASIGDDRTVTMTILALASMLAAAVATVTAVYINAGRD